LRCTPPPRFALPPPPLRLPLPPPPCRRHAAADVTLARCRHRQRPAVALPPPPLTLPLPPRRRQAAANVTLSRCRHHHSICAAEIALPPSRCAPPQRFALPSPLLTLPLPLRRRQAADNVALLRCRHRRSIHAAATALPPLRCAPPPRFVLPRPPAVSPLINLGTQHDERSARTWMKGV
jgi:hypothetical protein